MYMELFTIQHSSTYLFSQIHLDCASGPGLNIADSRSSVWFGQDSCSLLLLLDSTVAELGKNWTLAQILDLKLIV